MQTNTSHSDWPPSSDMAAPLTRITTDSASAPSLRVIFPALMLVLLLASLDQTIVSTALPTITAEFGGLEHLSWIVTAYMLATTAVSPIYGKLGDLYGRKVVLQAAIALFLIGSVLCGLSQNMGELIAFRAIQGLGGGGLMVATMAAVGDIIPSRQRGRYQGYFGAMFGLSTVVGPLIGGFFVQQLSWRWIFYVNLPLGILAFLALALAFPTGRPRERADIDYAGAVLLAITLTGIVLFTSLGGNVLPWRSAGTVGLAVLSLASLAAFLFVERRAAAPLLPLGLFRNSVFATSNLIGFIVGLSMFGAVTYLPLYLQVVKGSDPTSAGLQVTPMMAGVLISSIASGQIITRTGRYKIFPILGTAITAIGLLLLSTLALDTSIVTASTFMVILGLGLGMVMQVLVLAVQNAVPYEHLGVATSSATLFRSIGGSIGVSLFGALFAAGLASNLQARVGGIPGEMPGGLNPTVLHSLPGPQRDVYLMAFAEALHPVFAIASGLAILAFAASWFLKETPLKQNARGSDIGDSFAMQRDSSSISEAERILTELADRQQRARWYEDVAAKMQLTLRPLDLWLLARTGSCDDPASTAALSSAWRSNAAVLRRSAAALIEAGYATDTKTGLTLTPAGRALHDRILAHARQQLADFISGWAPDQHAELRALLDRVAASFVQEPPEIG